MNMKDEVSKLVEKYWLWLKDKTVLKEVGQEWIEITTPHLDRHNDFLQIYIKKINNRYLLTDDGYIISDLSASGCSLDSLKRQKMLKTVLAGFGIQLDGENLVVQASAMDFPIKKHNLVQAMLAVNDFFYLASDKSPYSKGLENAKVESVASVVKHLVYFSSLKIPMSTSIAQINLL